jgi:hypothetical protein
MGILHGVQGKFPEDVSGAAVVPETSENLPCTPYKIPQTENQYLFHDESLKSSFLTCFYYRTIYPHTIRRASPTPAPQTLSAFFCCSMRATCPTHFILLDVITTLRNFDVVNVNLYLSGSCFPGR